MLTIAAQIKANKHMTRFMTYQMLTCSVVQINQISHIYGNPVVPRPCLLVTLHTVIENVGNLLLAC